jgi:hypothetical protein
MHEALISPFSIRPLPIRLLFHRVYQVTQECENNAGFVEKYITPKKPVHRYKAWA